MNFLYCGKETIHLTSIEKTDGGDVYYCFSVVEQNIGTMPKGTKLGMFSGMFQHRILEGSLIQK
jgi:hypothetical protein